MRLSPSATLFRPQLVFAMFYKPLDLLPSPQKPVPDALEKVISSIMVSPQLSIQILKELPFHHLHRLIAIQLSNGSRFILKISPPPDTLLLRHEKDLLQREAATLMLLAKRHLPIPQIFSYELNATRFGSPFLLTNDIPGRKYSEALSYLSRSDKATVEAQLRSLRAIISQYSSSTFGLVREAGLRGPDKGYESWREAFVAMLESVLQDGEDIMVNIPFYELRAALTRWGSYLDDITEAKLVILGLGNPDNVLIEAKTNEVVGLLDFSMAIWGDPAMAIYKGQTDVKSLL